MKRKEKKRNTEDNIEVNLTSPTLQYHTYQEKIEKKLHIFDTCDSIYTILLCTYYRSQIIIYTTHDGRNKTNNLCSNYLFTILNISSCNFLTLTIHYK